MLKKNLLSIEKVMPWGLEENHFFLIKLVLFQINDQCFGKYFEKEQCKNISTIGPWGLKAKAGSALGCPPGSTAVFDPRHPSGDILNCQQTVPLK